MQLGNKIAYASVFKEGGVVRQPQVWQRKQLKKKRYTWTLEIKTLHLDSGEFLLNFEIRCRPSISSNLAKGQF